jgi:uncharacterized membrane protein YGL010W
MKTLEEWFALYEESHQNPVNKMFHKICIPPIVASTVGLLWVIPHPFGTALDGWMNWATIAVAASLYFYLRLNVRIFAIMTVALGVSLWASHLLAPVPDFYLAKLSAGLFITGWIGQLVGHKVEGKNPSFLNNLAFLLIGPAWLAKGFAGTSAQA